MFIRRTFAHQNRLVDEFAILEMFVNKVIMFSYFSEHMKHMTRLSARNQIPTKLE